MKDLIGAHRRVDGRGRSAVLEQIRDGHVRPGDHRATRTRSTRQFFEANRDLPLSVVRAEACAAHTRMLQEFDALPEVDRRGRGVVRRVRGAVHYAEHLPRLRRVGGRAARARDRPVEPTVADTPTPRGHGWHVRPHPPRPPRHRRGGAVAVPPGRGRVRPDRPAVDEGRSAGQPPAEDRYLMTVIATRRNPRFTRVAHRGGREGPTYTRGHAARPADETAERRPVLHHGRRRHARDLQLEGSRGRVRRWRTSSRRRGPGYDLAAFEAHAPTSARRHA